ncbi:hypothetical protein LCGC14_1872670, partial [marine sediment metagenome]
MERKKGSKKDLADKIKELEARLHQLDNKLKSEPAKEYEMRRLAVAVGTSPIGVDKLETAREIIKARKTSKQIAGLTKTTGDGSVLDDAPDIPFPTESIHEFANLDICECECHPKKNDCMNC